MRCDVDLWNFLLVLSRGFYGRLWRCWFSVVYCRRRRGWRRLCIIALCILTAMRRWIIRFCSCTLEIQLICPGLGSDLTFLV